MTEEPLNPIRQLIGNALIGSGILWIALSGLCSVWVMGQFLVQDPSLQDFFSSAAIVVIVGGISAGLGYLAMVIGRIIRGRK
jgi:hypothetical protein